ncbi:MAG TPA: cyclic pyranopterin monophosphate synthase MoaC [Desulfomicrobiaceae bacterium]|nr:cyclic pyranopterin monophosphate synthase MoaC [Desulfomicrobiaceae bacterium]
MEENLSHLDENGGIRMVDVGDKAQTRRRAIVRGVVQLSARTYGLLRDQGLPKGDVLTTAKVAGIQAAKQTAFLIPLCHPLPLSSVDVRFALNEEGAQVIIECEARTTGQTGVEMEALIGAQVAAATIYDMCKAVQRDIVISECRLVHKSGGKSGTYEYEG